MSKKVKLNILKVWYLRKQGLTYREIAKNFDCSQTTINSRYRAFKSKGVLGRLGMIIRGESSIWH